MFTSSKFTKYTQKQKQIKKFKNHIKDMEQVRIEYDGVFVNPEQEKDFWIKVEMGYDE